MFLIIQLNDQSLRFTIIEVTMRREDMGKFFFPICKLVSNIHFMRDTIIHQYPTMEGYQENILVFFKVYYVILVIF